jgi:hypothetical protein
MRGTEAVPVVRVGELLWPKLMPALVLDDAVGGAIAFGGGVGRAAAGTGEGAGEGAAKEILAKGLEDAGMAEDMAGPVPAPAAAAKGDKGDCAEPTPVATGSRRTLMILESRRVINNERDK